jgi:hypothetical protein
MRMMKLAIGLVLIQSAPLLAAPLDDAKCYMLSTDYAKSEQGNRKETAEVVHFYYLGRLNGALDPTRLGGTLIQAAKGMRPSAASLDMLSCVRNMQSAVASSAAATREANRMLPRGR